MNILKVNYFNYLKKHYERRKNKEIDLKFNYLKKHKVIGFRYFKKRYPKSKFFITCKQLRSMLEHLPKMPLVFEYIKWSLYDFLSPVVSKNWGIYCFIGLPSQGKTMSMTAHIERVKKKNKDIIIATNYGYKYQNFSIRNWQDIIDITKYCNMLKKKVLVAIDEVHLTFDATDYKKFPLELQALLSQNRHYNLQFLCSSQRYDRIPAKIRGLANYVVLSKNVFSSDRLFMNYYVECLNYEDGFTGKTKEADFTRLYVADNNLRKSYDTRYLVQTMKSADDYERKIFGEKMKQVLENN